MTNEMKLLRAFIEASGFDVEEIKTTTLDGVPLSKPEINAPFVEVDESDIRNIICATDYKVTKRSTWECDSNAKFTYTKDGTITYKGLDPNMPHKGKKYNE